MNRIVVLGGSGHVGSYLIPRLVELGYEVINVSRGASKPYSTHYTWKKVKNVSIDRVAAEKEGTFGKQIVDLEPNIV